MATIIALLAVVLIVFFAVRYIVKSKKSGAKCIGCPESGSCCKK
ncbi:MAG: FeoB-associated Cys-rich membrane protein [Lachnospiraceae bacterium]|nr:FeoB-associated Cys-rich membrane protein [Lachnospiraceae bacterium]